MFLRMRELAEAPAEREDKPAKIWMGLGQKESCGTRRSQKNSGGGKRSLGETGERRGRLRLSRCYGFTITFTAPSSLSEKIFSALLNSVSGKV